MRGIEERILLKRDINNIDEYIAVGGFQALKKAISMSPETIVKEIKKSGLRGRGGAGFPVSNKLETMVKTTSKKYLCCNAAEGEPGTFKDRYIIRKNPYQVIEGIAILAYTIGTAKSYIGLKVIFKKETERLEQALKECEDKGFIGKDIFERSVSLPVEIKLGPDHYLFGEETAFMNIIEGGACMPRPKPGYIVGVGNGMKIEPEDFKYVDGVPTLISNLETFANIPHIINNGGEWFKGIGIEENGAGTMVFTLSGDVKRPGIYELPMGTKLSTLVNEIGGGGLNGNIKAVLPGGPSNKILKGDELDVRLNYNSMKKAGSGLGSGCVIVFDETACMVKVASVFSVFFMKGSCGQCITCSDGTKSLMELLSFIERGRGSEKDITEIWSWIPQMLKPEAGHCYLVTADPTIISSIMQKFPQEFVQHIENGRCSLPREISNFKIQDFDEQKREFKMGLL
ncbi:MAG: NADH-quinone oxidoreductase subunit F [Nitrospirota bacterium]